MCIRDSSPSRGTEDGGVIRSLSTDYLHDFSLTHMHMQRLKAASHHQYLHLFRIRNEHCQRVLREDGFDHVIHALDVEVGDLRPRPLPGPQHDL